MSKKKFAYERLDIVWPRRREMVSGSGKLSDPDENRVRKVSVAWCNGDVTFYFEGSEEPFCSKDFDGETNRKMQRVENVMWKAWLKAKEIMPLRSKPTPRPAGKRHYF